MMNEKSPFPTNQIRNLLFQLNSVWLTIKFTLTSEDIEGQDKKIKSPLTLVDCLLKKTDLGFLKSFVTPGLFYLYNEREGYYFQLSKDDLKLLIKKLLESNTSLRIPMKTIEKVFKEITFDATLSQAGFPVFSSSHVVFTNGVMNLNTRLFSKFSPNVFCLGRVAFNYEPNAKDCPVFHDFLDSLCVGYADRKRFIQVMFNLILIGKLDLQVFFYIYGPGASGKSILIELLTLLLGRHTVHTTTLKSLHKDPFEIANLENKKLNVINDTEDYVHDMSVVKAYTGNDSLRGRLMRKNATLEVRAAGFIVAVGNQPLNVRDEGNAIARRIRPFKTVNVSSSRDSLLQHTSNLWTGPLYDEAPAIFNWVMSVKAEDYEIIKEPEIHVPSFESLQRETKLGLNPLLEWVLEETVKSEKRTPLGTYPTSKKLEAVMENKRFLYPTYFKWCKRNGLKAYTQKKFTNLFENVCLELNMPVVKRRQYYGTAYEGIEINEKVGETKYKIGDASKEEER